MQHPVQVREQIQDIHEGSYSIVTYVTEPGMYLVFNPINVTTPCARCRNKIKIYNQFSTINVMFYMRKCKLRYPLRTKFLSLFCVLLLVLHQTNSSTLYDVELCLNMCASHETFRVQKQVQQKIYLSRSNGHSGFFSFQ